MCIRDKINLMKEIETGLIEDGTAIGNGLATAVARLKDSDAKSKVVILLTDGVNNRGEIAPLMAAEIAKTYNIRVYTIGVGAMGTAPYPVMTPWGVRLQDIEAVSYTHLDVYKRQGIRWTMSVSAPTRTM